MRESGLDFDRVLPIFTIVFVDILGLTVILPLLHLYAAAYGATPLQIGMVVAAFPIAQLIGVPIIGRLSDRWGRKPLLLISQISTFIGFVMLGTAHTLVIIILSRVIDGLFGGNIATAQAALSDITTDKNRARGLGITGAAFGLGFILGPVISFGVMEFTNNLAMPAFTAAGYSFVSILLTLFMFRETLPSRQVGTAQANASSIRSNAALRLVRNPQVNLLLVLMFAQQVVFFGFESLLGLFTLSRLGIMGEGNSLIFIVVGVTLVTVQLRYIGRWTQKYGERKLILAALSLLALGLVLLAFTPQQPQPFYVRQIVENKLKAQALTSEEAVLGKIAVPLPEDGNNGVFGVLWVFVVIVPLSVGAGLIRPGLNSLMTQWVDRSDYGSILGLSASLVSAANAVAPLLGTLIFQAYGATTPFLVGGIAMGILAVASLLTIKPAPENRLAGEAAS